MNDVSPRASAPDAASQSLLDRGHLGEIMGMSDGPALAEFYAIYLRQTQSLCADLRADAAADDLPALERLAHKFKSSTSFIGAGPLAARLEQLEVLCRAGERQRVQAQLPATATLAGLTLQEIAAWRDELLCRS